MSSTNPENGTVNYAYNVDGTVLSRIGAKGQMIQYSYDDKKRVTQVRRYPNGSNLAQGKPASQSSTYGTWDASKAVDGNTDGNFSANSTTHTNVEANAWWQVDLAAAATISRIEIWTPDLLT